MANIIDSFRGSNYFLSNFYMCNFLYNEVEYKSIEHAFQSLKTEDENESIQIREAPTASLSKMYGRSCHIRKDWDSIKENLMWDLIRHKFQDNDLRDKLIATNHSLLVEGNDWGDTFWGICNGKGKNLLGELLMRMRAEVEWERKSGQDKYYI